MKKRTDFLEAFRKSGQDLKITPSTSAWRKLEQKLDARRHRRRVQLYSISGIAAAIALVVTLAAVLTLLDNSRQKTEALNNPAPRSFETLTADADVQTVKAVEFSRQNAQSVRPIAEGSSKQKLVLALQHKSGSQH